MKSIRSLLLAFFYALFLILVSCAGLTDPFFLDANVPDKDKSQMVTDAGVAQYRELIIKRGDIDSLNYVREYFEVALRYDPSNQTAKSYLAQIQDYRDAKFLDYLKKAQTLQKQTNRNENDNYVLAVWVQKASSMAPFDPDVITLSLQIAPARKELVKLYLERCDSALKKINKNTTDETKDKLYLEAFTHVSKALDIEPKHVEATRQKQELVASISAIINTRISSLEEFYKKGDFTSASNAINQLRELNKKLSNTFSQKLNDAEYVMYYKWAEWLLNKKEWAKAEAKADSAIGIKRISDAVSLKARINAERDKAEQGSSFETALASIDALIAKDDLNGAQRVISATSKKSLSPVQKTALNKRRDTVHRELSGLYERAVAAYREEKFALAVDLLETVIVIEADYEQASEYLEKAKAKKRLLELY